MLSPAFAAMLDGEEQPPVWAAEYEQIMMDIRGWTKKDPVAMRKSLESVASSPAASPATGRSPKQAPRTAAWKTAQRVRSERLTALKAQDDRVERDNQERLETAVDATRRELFALREYNGGELAIRTPSMRRTWESPNALAGDRSTQSTLHVAPNVRIKIASESYFTDQIHLPREGYAGAHEYHPMEHPVDVPQFHPVRALYDSTMGRRTSIPVPLSSD